MADVRPLNALHYNLAAVRSLADVVAPPYDVIDAARRAELLARSPFNVVEIDLPEAPGRRRSLRARRRDARGVDAAGHPQRRPRAGALGADPGLRRPRRHSRAPAAGSSAGSGSTALRPGAGPPARAHPAGPEGGPARLTRATRHNLSPIFSLHEGDAWRHVEGYTRGEPWGEVTDDDGTVHRVWRIDDPDVHARSPPSSPTPELLIADGHHRYETARAYADEIGGEGPHRYTLMALVSLDDPGLTVFGYHRLLSGLGDPERQEALRDGAARALRGRGGRRSSSSTRPARRASASSATSTPTTARASACGSRTRPRSTRRSPAPRGLPPARRGDPRDAACCAARSG